MKNSLNSNCRISPVIILGFFVFGAFNAFASEDRKIDRKQMIMAVDYNPKQKLNNWVMSEKYDGMRAYWNGHELLSRNGHKINAPNWFVKSFPDFELDGELWLARQKFAELMSIVKDAKPILRWNEVKYKVFEVPNQSGGLLDRVAVLKHYLDANPNPYIDIVAHSPIHSHQAINEALEAIVKEGGEGLIIRDSSRKYLVGRDPSIQKVKLKQDAECIVSGYTQGKGRYLGKVGAIKCTLLTHQVKRLFPKLTRRESNEIKLGSGLTDPLRENPPKIGSLVTFSYLGTTKNGYPRFPVYLRLRHQ